MKVIRTVRETYTYTMLVEVEAPVAPRTITQPAPAPKAIEGRVNQPQNGDIVEYTSQQGRTNTYEVVWNRVIDGTMRVKLVAPGVTDRKAGFFVDAAKCRLIRRAR